jgi:integrase
MLGDPNTIALLNAARTPFNGPIVLNQYRRQYQSAYHLNQFYRKAHKDANVRLRKGPYPWRHTYASLGIQAGLPPAFLAKQLGHSLNVFYSHYATWITGDDDRALAQKLARALAS